MVRYRRSEMEFSLLPSSYEKVIRLWVLNILLGLSAHRNFIDERGFSDDEIVEFLGLTDLSLIKPFDAQAARTALREKHSKALARPAGIPTNSCIAKNITWLRDMAGLSEVEQIHRFSSTTAALLEEARISPTIHQQALRALALLPQ